MNLFKSLFITLILSANVLATGGFECETTDKSFSIGATTASVYGNPIVGDIYGTINKQEVSISNSRVTGYWNIASSLKIAAIDEDYNNLSFSIEADIKANESKAKGFVTFQDGSVKPVTCIW